MKKNKRGQITIFVILSLIIVSGIILFFLLRKPPNTTVSSENPNLYIQNCVKGPLDKGIEIISKQGGDINPKGSIMYGGYNLTYLCYTSGYYKQCINQRPLLIEHIEEQLKDYITPQIKSCFDGLRIELEKKGEVELGTNMDFNVSLKPKQVIVNINRNLKITKGDSSQNFKEFNIKIINPLYDLAEIATEISNQEARYCNFNLLGFMLIYPNYEITKNRDGNSNNIYTVRFRGSEDEFKFAVRTCVLPAGI
jgi:hypothetical protein